MTLALDLTTIAAAVLLAAVGGESFLRAIVSGALHLRVPKALVATTLAAMATSAPEFTVSTLAALSGQPQIGLGDALGSNVVNIALIFGLVLACGTVHAQRKEYGFDFVLALVVPGLTYGMLADGLITRGEGLGLLAIFAGWLIWHGRRALHHRRHEAQTNAEIQALSAARTLALAILGLAALIVAGRLFVTGAVGLASDLGWPMFVVGAVVVAIGTSMPELATALVALWRGHHEVGVGTLIGSNLFNGLAIVGAAASIQPIATEPGKVGIALACGFIALLLILPRRSGEIPRMRAWPLLALYGLFIVLTGMR